MAQGRELEIDYPILDIPDIETPTTTKTFLPAYIEYIFTWAIIIAGLLAFFALVYGGILYLTSAGNPSKMSDAKEQVIAGFLGLIILLSSYLILKTIDPQLVILKKPTMEQAIGGIKIYSKTNCQSETEKPSLQVSSSIPKLKRILDWGGLNWGADGDYEIKSILFLNNSEELTISFFPDNEYKPEDNPIITYGKEDTNYNKGGCKTFPGGVQPRSVKLDYRLPGVYLYANSTTCGTSKIDEDKPIEVKVYQGSSATLPEFDNETKSIKFIYDDCDENNQNCKTKYAAILHQYENFMGKAMLFDQNQGKDNCKNLSENLISADGPKDIGVSSITVYLKPIESPLDETDKGVAFYEDKNHTGCRLPETEDEFYKDGRIEPDIDIDDFRLCGEDCNDKTCEDRISSMEMRGNYIALLFKHSNYKGDCEVFTKRDSYFRDNRIGQCGWLGRKDCLTSFIIKARK